MIQKKLRMGLWAGALVALMPANVVHAGFLDTFDRATQAVQQTTGRIENTQNTVHRAGNLIKKTPKQEAAAKAVAKPQVSGALSAKDRAAIEKAKRAWVAAFKAEDWDALVDQYADNAVILPPDEQAQSGHEAIRANFATDEDTSNEVFETVTIDGDDKIAYVQGAFHFTIKSANTPPADVSGKYIEVWGKQPDGSWLITHDIWNADPLPGADIK